MRSIALLLALLALTLVAVACGPADTADAVGQDETAVSTDDTSNLLPLPVCHGAFYCYKPGAVKYYFPVKDPSPTLQQAVNSCQAAIAAGTCSAVPNTSTGCGFFGSYCAYYPRQCTCPK